MNYSNSNITRIVLLEKIPVVKSILIIPNDSFRTKQLWYHHRFPDKKIQVINCTPEYDLEKEITKKFTHYSNFYVVVSVEQENDNAGYEHLNFSGSIILKKDCKKEFPEHHSSMSVARMFYIKEDFLKEFKRSVPLRKALLIFKLKTESLDNMDYYYCITRNVSYSGFLAFRTDLKHCLIKFMINLFKSGSFDYVFKDQNAVSTKTKTASTIYEDMKKLGFDYTHLSILLPSSAHPSAVSEAAIQNPMNVFSYHTRRVFLNQDVTI